MGNGVKALTNGLARIGAIRVFLSSPYLPLTPFLSEIAVHIIFQKASRGQQRAAERRRPAMRTFEPTTLVFKQHDCIHFNTVGLGSTRSFETAVGGSG